MSPVAYLTATVAIPGFFVAPASADTIAKCTLDDVTISDGGTSFQVAIMIAVSRLAVYYAAFGGEAELDRGTEAVLFRKKLDARRVRSVMRGRAEDLVRHVMSAPPKMRPEYFIKDGRSDCGSQEIESLAREFDIGGRRK